MIAVFCQSADPQRQIFAANLAHQLDLPQTPPVSTSTFAYLLVVTDTHLELQQTTTKTKPIIINFHSASATYRRYHGGGKNELIARALGIKGSYQPSVIDATAGLGQDAFVLACLGCHVHCLERSSVIAALLADGIQRASHELQSLLSLTVTNAIDYLNHLATADYPDVIYLDPMFPERSKSALVKKEMRVLRDIVGDDTDTTLLLTTALSRAKKRVVVKRPRLAPAIAGPQTNAVLKGRSSRFDIYHVG